MLSVTYFMLVLFFEVFFLLNPDRAARFIAMCTPKSSRSKRAAKTTGDESSAGTAGSKGKDTGKIEMHQNALVMRSMHTTSSTDFAESILDRQEPPTPMEWAAVRMQAKNLQARVSELQDSIREASRSGHAAALEASATASSGRGGKSTRRSSVVRSPSARARQFAPMQTLTGGKRAGGILGLSRAAMLKKRLERSPDAPAVAGAPPPPPPPGSSAVPAALAHGVLAADGSSATANPLAHAAAAAAPNPAGDSRRKSVAIAESGLPEGWVKVQKKGKE